MPWRVKEMCGNCPFAKSGAGLHLRKSLARGRWESILRSLRFGKTFPCHKTVEYYDEDGEAISGTGLTCAGAIAWQEEHDCVSKLQRFAESLERARRKSDANAR